LDLRLWKTRAGKSDDYREAIVFEKLRFQNVFCPHQNGKPAFSNFSGLEGSSEGSVLVTQRRSQGLFSGLGVGPPPCQGKGPRNEVARDGLLWTVGLTVVVIHQMFSLAHDWSKRFM